VLYVTLDAFLRVDAKTFSPLLLLGRDWPVNIVPENPTREDFFIPALNISETAFLIYLLT